MHWMLGLKKILQDQNSTLVGGIYRDKRRREGGERRGGERREAGWMETQMLQH